MKRLLPACVVALSLLHVASAAQTQGRGVAVPRAGGVDWPNFGWDVSHSGASTSPSGVSIASLPLLQRQQVPIDGIVDASLIYLHAVQINGATHDAFFATTSYGKTIAIDAGTGAILWTFTPPGIDGWAGSAQITNSTPSADSNREFIYAASPDGKIEKLAVADGHAAWSTAITALPTREKIASPPTYFQGRVIAVTGGYIGDAPPYQGHVSVLDASTGALLHTWNSLCSDRLDMIQPSSCQATRSAIWGRAGAVIDPANGQIFIATGNGPWDGKTSWGDAVLQLSADATQMVGNYTPTNTEDLNARDADVGSTSPALLGGGYLAQGGKDGTIRVLSVQAIKGTDGHRGGELQVVSTPSGNRLFTAPVVAHIADKTWMFAADGGGTAAWTFANGTLTPAWHNTVAGTSPVVAAGLLYVYDPSGSLRIYDPQTGAQVAALACGAGHWNSPIVVDGRIALPEGSANNGSAHSVIDIWRVGR